MRIKSIPITDARVKAGPADDLNEGEFLVYPSTFTRQPDSYGDVVAKGAFKRGIEERREKGTILPGLFGHRMDDPDFYVAHAIEEGEDEHGWWVKGAFDLDDPKAAKVYRLVKGRRINELSFAYDALDEGQVVLEDGTKANELRDLEVFEFSFVPVGANRDTSVVTVKAAADHLITDIKAGRAISAKNESELRTAHEAIGRVLAALSAGSEEDDSKANDREPANDEEPPAAKSEEPTRASSARVLAQIKLAELDDNFNLPEGETP